MTATYSPMAIDGLFDAALLAVLTAAAICPSTCPGSKPDLQRIGWHLQTAEKPILHDRRMVPGMPFNLRR